MNRYVAKNEEIITWLDSHIMSLPDDMAYKLFSLRRQYIKPQRRPRGYTKYLDSLEWTDTRNIVIEQTGHKCAVCNQHEDIYGLHIHHRSYKTFGNNNFDDLIPLCPTCHSYIHPYALIAERIYRKIVGKYYAGYIFSVECANHINQTKYYIIKSLSNEQHLLRFSLIANQPQQHIPEDWDIISLDKKYITHNQWNGSTLIPIEPISPQIRIYQPDRPLDLWRRHILDHLQQKQLVG